MRSDDCLKTIHRTYRRHPCRTTARYADSNEIHPQRSDPQSKMTGWPQRLNPVQCRSGHATGSRVSTRDGDPYCSRITHLRCILRPINDYERTSIPEGYKPANTTRITAANIRRRDQQLQSGDFYFSASASCSKPYTRRVEPAIHLWSDLHNITAASDIRRDQQ